MAAQTARAATWSAKTLREAVRFGIVGIVSVALNTLSIYLLTELFRINYLVSYLIVFFFCTVVGFRLNRGWSFRIVSGDQHKEFFRYLSVMVLTLIVAITAIHIFVALWGNYVIAVTLVSAGLAPLNFFVHRGWSFGRSLGCDHLDR